MEKQSSRVGPVQVLLSVVRQAFLISRMAVARTVTSRASLTAPRSIGDLVAGRLRLEAVIDPDRRDQNEPRDQNNLHRLVGIHNGVLL